MRTIRGQIEIARPIEETFDFVADETNEPRYNDEMIRCEKVTPGPIGFGTRCDAEMKTRTGTFPMTIEVTGFERPNRLASRSHLETMDIRGELKFEAIDDRTRMSWEWELEPHGCMRVLGPIVTRMGQRQEERIWTRLKQLLEGETPPAEAGRRV